MCRIANQIPDIPKRFVKCLREVDSRVSSEFVRSHHSVGEIRTLDPKIIDLHLIVDWRIRRIIQYDVRTYPDSSRNERTRNVRIRSRLNVRCRCRALEPSSQLMPDVGRKPSGISVESVRRDVNGADISARNIKTIESDIELRLRRVACEFQTGTNSETIEFPGVERNLESRSIDGDRSICTKDFRSIDSD